LTCNFKRREKLCGWFSGRISVFVEDVFVSQDSEATSPRLHLWMGQMLTRCCYLQINVLWLPTNLNPKQQVCG